MPCLGRMMMVSIGPIMSLRQRMERARDAVQLASAMVRNNDRLSTFIDSTPGVIAGKKSLGHNGARPHLPYPSQVLPTGPRVGKRGPHIDQVHRTFSWNHNIPEFRNSAIQQEGSKPTGMREDVRKEACLWQ